MALVALRIARFVRLTGVVAILNLKASQMYHYGHASHPFLHIVRAFFNCHPIAISILWSEYVNHYASTRQHVIFGEMFLSSVL
jgi:hypothetical protein